jgi:hypothetical protein
LTESDPPPPWKKNPEHAPDGDIGTELWIVAVRLILIRIIHNLFTTCIIHT